MDALKHICFVASCCHVFRPRRRTVGQRSYRRDLGRSVPWLSLFVHFVWATWDRAPLITPRIERSLHRNIESEAIKQGCKVVAINGIEDHVHVLLMLPSTISIAVLVQQMKGVSSHFINDVHKSNTVFKWQGSYGAFSVSRHDVDRVVDYIKRQKEHHRENSLWDELEARYEEIGTGIIKSA